MTDTLDKRAQFFATSEILGATLTTQMSKSVVQDLGWFEQVKLGFNYKLIII